MCWVRSRPDGGVVAIPVQTLDHPDETRDGAHLLRRHAADAAIRGMHPAAHVLLPAADQGVESAIDADQQQGELAGLLSGSRQRAMELRSRPIISPSMSWESPSARPAFKSAFVSTARGSGLVRTASSVIAAPGVECGICS